MVLTNSVLELLLNSSSQDGALASRQGLRRWLGFRVGAELGVRCFFLVRLRVPRARRGYERRQRCQSTLLIRARLPEPNTSTVHLFRAVPWSENCTPPVFGNPHAEHTTRSGRCLCFSVFLTTVSRCSTKSSCNVKGS